MERSVFVLVLNKILFLSRFEVVEHLDGMNEGVLEVEIEWIKTRETKKEMERHH